MRFLKFAAAFSALVFAAGQIQAGLIFDSFDGGSSHSYRLAGSSPGSFIFSVAQDTRITNISVLNQMFADGQLKFLIADHATHSMVYISGAQSFAASETSTWKLSNDFSFLFKAGKQYDVGAIANVNAYWNYDMIGTSMNGISSIASNPNFMNFASPQTEPNGGHATTDGAVRLYGSVLPEPASMALWGLGTLGMGLLVRRRQRKLQRGQAA